MEILSLIEPNSMLETWIEQIRRVGYRVWFLFLSDIICPSMICMYGLCLYVLYMCMDYGTDNVFSSEWGGYFQLLLLQILDGV